MKQIIECLDRAFNRQKPLTKKWRAVISEHKSGNNYLFLMHYHHLILVYDLDEDKALHKWWELPADKRGLEAALDYLKERKEENGNVYRIEM